MGWQQICLQGQLNTVHGTAFIAYTVGVAEKE